MVDDARAASGDLDTVGVLGAGLIGGSITRALLELGVPVEVVDPDPAAVARAVEAGARGRTLSELAGTVDVAFLCPPPSLVATTWREWLEASSGRGPDRRRSVVLDVASVKRPVLDQLAADGTPSASPSTVLVLSHPMAGREQAGWDASDPALFRGASWILLPPAELTGEELLRCIRSVEALGATVCFMDPTFHDRFAAVTSHIAHVVAFTFQALVDEVDPRGWRRFSGNSLRDLLRVAGADHDLWTEILEGNEAELGPLLADLASRIDGFDASRDIPAEPPQDPRPAATGPDGQPRELILPWGDPLGAQRAALLATGEAGLELTDWARRPESGELRLTFGAPVASSP